jgi:hypothetical protein
MTNTDAGAFIHPFTKRAAQKEATGSVRRFTLIPKRAEMMESPPAPWKSILQIGTEMKAGTAQGTRRARYTILKALRDSWRKLAREKPTTRDIAVDAEAHARVMRAERANPESPNKKR